MNPSLYEQLPQWQNPSEEQMKEWETRSETMILFLATKGEDDEEWIASFTWPEGTIEWWQEGTVEWVTRDDWIQRLSDVE